MSRRCSAARVGRPTVLLVAAGLLGAVALAPAAPARAAPVCTNNSQANQDARDEPWAQKQLALKSAWRYSRGSGVRVGVVDSGVAPVAHLGGRVVRGVDLLDRTGDGRLDCAGHGTAVAAIIAAGERPGIGFVGVAPSATILPVRITDTDIPVNSDPNQPPTPPARMAAAIDAARAAGARVIVVSLVLFGDDPAKDRQGRAVKDGRGNEVGVVELAVRRAVAGNVVVVAAVGDGHELDDKSEPPSVPAGYPGVLGVGAVDEEGARVGKSQVGPYVDVVAPGDDVLAANRSETYGRLSGTSFAAAYAGGVAALVRSADPSLSAAAVVTRMMASASPARGGSRTDEYGHGVVDPSAAVTAVPVTGRPRPAEPVRPPVDAPEALEADERSARLDARAEVAAATAAAVLAFVVLLAVVVPLARRRRWASGRPAPTRSTDEIDEADEKFYTPPGLRTRG